MSALNKIGDSIQKNPISWAIGAVVVGVGGWFLIGKLKGAASGLKEKIQAGVDENKLIAAGQSLSYPLTAYQGFADAIEAAGKILFGTDEDAIYGVFAKMNNDLDVLQVFKAFGKRRPEWTTGEVDLGGFLNSELDAGEMTQLNKILESKNIKYRF